MEMKDKAAKPEEPSPFEIKRNKVKFDAIGRKVAKNEIGRLSQYFRSYE